MMTWLTWIWWVIRYAPTIIATIRAIIKAIESIKDEKAKASAQAQFDRAMTDIKDRGDFSELERMKDRCGLRCRIEERRNNGKPKET
jgi:phage shock protein A